MQFWLLCSNISLSWSYYQYIRFLFTILLDLSYVRFILDIFTLHCSTIHRDKVTNTIKTYLRLGFPCEINLIKFIRITFFQTFRLFCNLYVKQAACSSLWKAIIGFACFYLIILHKPGHGSLQTVAHSSVPVWTSHLGFIQ